MMVTPIAAEILEVAIPFRLTFRHALAARSAGSSVIVRLVDEHGHTGFGEGAPREYVSGESLATVTAALQEMLPAFLCRSQATLAQAADELAAFARALPRHAHAAFCALELALLDLVG